jgi:Flp pilus assembly protein TadG
MTSPTPVARLLRRARRDDGSATAELVVATPLLLLMLMAIVQFTVWSHATHVAQAAATEGLGAARAQSGDAAEGRQTATRLLLQLAGGPLTDATVEAVRDGTSATVTVTGTTTPVIPFLTLPVKAVASGPVERFTPTGAPR